MKQLKNVFAILTLLFTALFIACNDGNGGDDKDSGASGDSVVCTYYMKDDTSVYYVFYGDGSVEYHANGKIANTRSELIYSGNPLKAGTVSLKISLTGTELISFNVKESNGTLIPTVELVPGFPVEYTLSKDSTETSGENDNSETSGTDKENTNGSGESENGENGGTESPEEPSTDIDESPLMFMGFDNVVTIEKGTDITGITNTIYSLTSDTTLKFKGGINSITLTTIAAAIGTNDSVKIALDFSEATGITEWTNKLAGQKTLYAISLPSTVTSVQDGAFANCTNLKAITVPKTITEFPSVDSEIIVNLKMTLEDWLNASMKISGTQPLYLNDEEVSGEVIVPDGISTIRSGAFSNCPNLTKIVLPESVTSIESYAFANCGSTIVSSWGGNSTSVTLSFTCGAQLLESINLENVTNIGDYAFAKCNSLREINLVKMISVGVSAFYECSNLATVTINGNYYYSEPSIGNFAFCNCSALKSVNLEYIKSIGEYAFYGCSSLTSVTIPSNMSTIQRSTFSGCTGLMSVIIPSNITNIEYNAFGGCSGLTNVTLPLSVDGIGRCKIGDFAFYGCSNLTNIRIPETIDEIGESAFSNCTNLRNVIFEEESEERITANQGRYSLSCSKNLFTECPLETVYIGRILSTDTTKASYSPFYNQEGLVSVEISYWSGINKYLFYGCSNLTSITIDNANHITDIGEYAFYNCSSLTSVTIPNTVESIGQYAFYGCSSLTSITIPSSVGYIYNFAFTGCSRLKELIIEDGQELLRMGYHTYNKNTIGKSLFFDCPLEKVYLGRNIISLSTFTYNYGYGPFYRMDTMSTLQIGANVSEITSYMFYGCNALTHVALPNGITYIEEYAFANCIWLKSITIPASVKRIAIGAFNECTSLETVYYVGNEEQWNEIGIVYSNNVQLTNATIYYNVYTGN